MMHFGGLKRILPSKNESQNIAQSTDLAEYVQKNLKILLKNENGQVVMENELLKVEDFNVSKPLKL